MDLLIPIAANAIVGLMLAALFVGLRRSDAARLTSAADAMAVFQRDYPDLRGTATLGDDGQSALIALAHSRGVGLVHRHGRRWNARVLQPGDLAAPAVARGDGLELATTDFGWPHSRVRIGDPEERARWLARLMDLNGEAANSPSPETPHA